MVDIVIVGSVALDSVKTPFGAVSDALGGAASYAAFAASFFSRPGIVGVVGDDFPEEHIELLRSRDISTAGIKTSNGKTFRWSGYYEYDMNQAHTTETQLNVFENFSPELPEDYKKSKNLFLANIDPALQLTVLSQMNPKLVVADTMNYWIEKKREQLMEVIKKSNVFLLNDSEARELLKTTNLISAGRKMLSLGPDAVIIKKGEDGALLLTDSKIFSLPGYPLENVRDPTGAGDSFAGAFIGYLSKNGFDESSVRKAIVYGSAVASFNVEDFSLNRLKKITMNDIEARYSEFEAMVRF
ncbi:MAG: sugar kinase [Candidatus Aenigmarchaeota archaeon]|nr:sugar kinase [Candidatus Aenigmarchaeota archaeon]